MIDCPEAVRRMWSYLEGSLEITPTEELNAHLDTCQRCCGELEFNRHLRTMVAERDGAPAVPAEVRARVEILLGGADDSAAGRA